MSHNHKQVAMSFVKMIALYRFSVFSGLVSNFHNIVVIDCIGVLFAFSLCEFSNIMSSDSTAYSKVWFGTFYCFTEE